MGKGNVAVRQWISDKKRFADLFNGVVFQGRQIVSSDETVIIGPSQRNLVKSRGFADLVLLFL